MHHKRRAHGGGAVHATPGASLDAAPGSALNASISAARYATGAALSTRRSSVASSLVGVFFLGASGEGQVEDWAEARCVSQKEG